MGGASSIVKVKGCSLVGALSCLAALKHTPAPGRLPPPFKHLQGWEGACVC